MGTELFPKVSATKWAKRYNIEIRSRPCQKCGITQKTTIPWASKDWRGLVAPIHECGEEYELVTAVPTNNAERDSWRSFINLWGEIVTADQEWITYYDDEGRGDPNETE